MLFGIQSSALLLEIEHHLEHARGEATLFVDLQSTNHAHLPKQLKRMVAKMRFCFVEVRPDLNEQLTTALEEDGT